MRYILFSVSVFFCTMLFARATEFSGTVKSVTDKPLSKAIVVLSKTELSEPISVHPVSSDGSFRFSADMNGAYVLRIAAPDHQSQTYKGYLADNTETLPFTATLPTNISSASVKEVQIIGAFNNWNFQSSKKMDLQKDGSFAIELPSENGKIEYQVLVGAADDMLHSINGTQNDSMYYDGGGDFRSVVFSKKGKTTIIYNPKLAAYSDKGGEIVLLNNNQKYIDSLFAEPQEMWMRVELNLVKAGIKQGPELDEKIRAHFAEKISEFYHDVNNAKSPTLKSLHSAILLNAISWSRRTKPEDSVFLSNIFTYIPANSSLWSTSAQTYVGAWGNRNFSFTADVLATISKEKNVDVSWGWFTLLRRSHHSNNPTVATLCYNNIMELYPGTDAAKNAKREYDPNKKITVGKSLPDFSFASLDNPSENISAASLRGKWVLIDLWATWCGPCIGEMPSMHDAYEAMKGKNFTIVSISLDRDKNNIAPFREKRWKMPWQHIFTEGIFESPAAQLFEVTGIPKPILIDPNGKIVAITVGLRGEELVETLKRYVQ